MVIVLGWITSFPANAQPHHGVFRLPSRRSPLPSPPADALAEAFGEHHGARITQALRNQAFYLDQPLGPGP